MITNILTNILKNTFNYSKPQEENTMLFEKSIIKAYKTMVYTRCDDSGTTFYFSKENFPRLYQKPYTFIATAGHQLQGYFYYYDHPIQNRIIIFDHGFGGGHRSYMKEIERLCKAGYLVFAYDHTGCMESGGSDTNGMAQSLCDLNDCINALQSNSQLKQFDISVVGHSWGGFSALNISAIHPEISKIVVLSGFISVKSLINTYFRGILKGFRKSIMNVEEKANPIFAKYNAVESLSQSNVETLLIYSDNDALCKKEIHYDPLYTQLSTKKNIHFKLVSHRGHNPNYTEDAVKYLNEYIIQKRKLMKRKLLETNEQKEKFLASFDWDKMTEQDEKVWSSILSHLK